MSSLQQPIHSGFNAASTAAEVIQGIDLKGKTAIVTGGYSGLGLETVRVLLAAGAEVIVPARDVARAQAQMGEVKGAQVWPMDLLDPQSIDAFAERFLASHKTLHILINNAGIMALPELSLDARGYELQFATNHLGHFQLVARLWPALKAANGARIVSLSSRGHRFSSVVFEDINFTQRAYDPWLAYGQSKTANVLFAVELDRLGQEHGIRAFAVHPGGIVDTNLAKHIDAGEFRAMGHAMGLLDANDQPIIDPFNGLKTVQQGASTQTWCATSPSLQGMGGVYCEDTEVAVLMPELDGANLNSSMAGFAQGGVKAYALDAESAKRLWALSEEMMGVSLSA